MEEKEIPPEDTSGTEPMVVRRVLQVMEDWIAVAVSETSAGRALEPTMKQAAACRGLNVGAGLVC